MYIPSAIQLAHGWTRLGIYTNSAGVIVLVPLVIVLAQRYGGAGAASVWMILNAGYLLIALPYMHSRLLKGELRKWYCGDVGLPLLSTVCIGWGGTLFISSALPKGLLIASLAGLALVMVSTEILMSTELRTRLAERFIQWQ
jgi:O-antigen/teichoic acid export membrane protein